MEWKYKTELKDKNVFDELEEKYKIKIPQNIRDFICEYNGSSPSKYCYMLNGEEKMFGAVFSYNYVDEEADTVFSAYESIKESNIIPIARDPFGNYICFDANQNTVVYYEHENENYISSNKDLNNFIEELY